MYVNEDDGQLWAAHLILGYTLIFLAFEAPKYVIKASDPRLHRISVAYEGFVVLEGIPILEGTPLTRPLFIATPSVGASSSQFILEEEAEEEEKEKEEEEKKSLEGIVDLSDSSEEFEVFNQAPSPEGILVDIDFQHQAEVTTLDEMGIYLEETPKEFDGINRIPAWKRCTGEIHTAKTSSSSSQISSSFSSTVSAI